VSAQASDERDRLVLLAEMTSSTTGMDAAV